MRVARTGLYRYRMPDGTERVEYRGPEELKRIAAQLKDLPISLLHPGKKITPDSWRETVVGHVSSVEPELELHDGEQWIVAQGVFSDATAIKMLESGELRELSLGCDMTQDPGPPPPGVQGAHAEQLGLVPNHLASLPPDNARAGREARVLLDSGDEDYPTMALTDNTDQGALAQKLADALTALGAANAKIATLEATAATDKTRLDSLQVELATATGELKTSKERLDALDPETLAEDLIQFRADMTPALPADYVLKGKSKRQVRLDAAKHLGGEYDDKATDQVLDGFIAGCLKTDAKDPLKRSKIVPHQGGNKDQKTPAQIRAAKVEEQRLARAGGK
jgi:hypothetical protein